MEPSGSAALAPSNKENVPDAPAGKAGDRRASLAPWAAVGPTPSKLQDLARRCVRGAAACRPSRLQARNGPHAGGGRAAPQRRRSAPRRVQALKQRSSALTRRVAALRAAWRA
jgi:hypothetical protein